MKLASFFDCIGSNQQRIDHPGKKIEHAAVETGAGLKITRKNRLQSFKRRIKIDAGGGKRRQTDILANPTQSLESVAITFDQNEFATRLKHAGKVFYCLHLLID